MRIVIGNLPDKVSEEEIREALEQFAPAEIITLDKENGTQSAVIEMKMTRAVYPWGKQRRRRYGGFRQRHWGRCSLLQAQWGRRLKQYAIPASQCDS